MIINLLRMLLIVAALFIAVNALKYRLIKRPVATDIFDQGHVDIDVAGIDHTHKIAEDTLSTSERTADGIVRTRFTVSNQSNMATQYSIVAELKSGLPEVYDRVQLSISDHEGQRLWEGPITNLSQTDAFQSILPVGQSEELQLSLMQTVPNSRSAVEVEFQIFANPLGAATDPETESL